MKNIKEFDAIFFKQPGNDKYIMATFVVGSSDLIEWAGVPRKKNESTSKISFQRSLDDRRLDKIKMHFENCVTPNSILLTIAEKDITNINEISESVVGTSDVYVGKLKINIDNTGLRLEEAIEKVLELLKSRLSKKELLELEETETSHSLEITDISYEAEEISDDNLTVEESLECESQGFEITTKSHLVETIEFLTRFLENYKLNNECYSEEEINSVNSFCNDYLKPAFLVDGQHRTFGAYSKIVEEYENGNGEYEILLPVCAIINSDWKESVFQFVIINQTAQRIESKFLSSIISTSLTDDELSTFRRQLENSGAPVGEAILINELNTRQYIVDERNINPFYSNIEFGVQNESEQLLRYSTVKSLVDKIRNFKDNSNTVFGKTYQGFSDYLREIDINQEEWKNKYWIDFMVCFWNLVEDKFVSNKKLRYEMYKEDNDSKIHSGTNLSLKVSMEYIQDSFISYIVKNSKLLKKIGINKINISDGVLLYYDIQKLFECWCEDHNKNYNFFERNWKGLSSYKRNNDKFEGINSAFSMDKYGSSKLCKG